jgi:pimeloyl-ACP methyl ester carboxylesterase
MTPFYFGDRRRRLFGIYEPAVLKSVGKRAAVLCYPWGAEYVHAHRTMRQLAVRLSAAGIDTLRFDFFGTGDSAGEMVDADLAGWETDIELAIQELRDIVGSARVTLIGLRLGATLAARVAARRPRDVDTLVLWDPIQSGTDYLTTLGAAEAPSAFSPPLVVRGFPLTVGMRRDLRAIALTPPLAPPGARELTLITDRGNPRATPAEPPGGNGERSNATEFMAAVSPWIEDPNNMGAVPVQVIQRIVRWLG